MQSRVEYIRKILYVGGSEAEGWRRSFRDPSGILQPHLSILYTHDCALSQDKDKGGTVLGVLQLAMYCSM